MGKDGRDETMVIGRAMMGLQTDVPGIMRSTRISIHGEGFVGQPAQDTFFVTSLDDGKYMNIFDESALHASNAHTWDPKSIKSYRLIKYRVSDEKLEIWPGTSNRTIEAVKSGKIRGVVKKDEFNREEAKLTDTTANLCRYINSGGGKILFSDGPKEVYVRARVP
jgi:hypothetical protein